MRREIVLTVAFVFLLIAFFFVAGPGPGPVVEPDEESVPVSTSVSFYKPGAEEVVAGLEAEGVSLNG